MEQSSKKLLVVDINSRADEAALRRLEELGIIVIRVIGDPNKTVSILNVE